MTLDRRNGRNPNLGFGMVPPKPVKLDAYTTAAQQLLDVLSGGPATADTPASVSEVKGLCNRILREDQPDWALVWLWMGLPSKLRLKWIVADLPALRQACLADDPAEQSYIVERVQRAGLMTALSYFVKHDEPPQEPGMGYLYLLSTRADRKLLKIGQTTRDVPKRVEEINRATGVVEPLSPRRIWRVRDPVETEKRVHELLADYRVRSDREFFRLELSEAAPKIEQYLRDIDGKMRLRGAVEKIFPDRRYGFIRADDLDYFFHASEVRNPNFSTLQEGDHVSFDRLDTSFGLAAADIQRAGA